MRPFRPSGPVHPCPVCGSADQTCGAGVEVHEPIIEDRPPQGDGPLIRARHNGMELMLTADDIERLGAQVV